MNPVLIPLAFIILSGPGVAQAQSVPAAAPGLCRPEAAERLAGRSRVSDRRAMRLTGATLVRQIAPGQPVTRDYRRERVTIETDPRSGRIVRATCG